MSTPTPKVIAQLMRDDAVTIICKFPNYDRKYVFLCQKTLADRLRPEDQVLVEVYEKGQHVVKCVDVVQIQDTLDIDLDAGISYYKWAFQKVDIRILEKLQARDNKLADSIKARRREAIRQRVLEEYTGENLLAPAIRDNDKKRRDNEKKRPLTFDELGKEYTLQNPGRSYQQIGLDGLLKWAANQPELFVKEDDYFYRRES